MTVQQRLNVHSLPRDDPTITTAALLTAWALRSHARDKPIAWKAVVSLNGRQVGAFPSQLGPSGSSTAAAD